MSSGGRPSRAGSGPRTSYARTAPGTGSVAGTGGPTTTECPPLAGDGGLAVPIGCRVQASPSQHCKIEPIVASVEKTGRAIVAHEASGFLGLGAEIAATVTERAFYSLEAPVLRVTGFDIPFPPARLEKLHLPDADRVLDAVDRAFAY